MARATYVRTAAKAVIIREDAVLAVKFRAQDEVYYTLPGGGQRPGETLADTMARECLEEIGVRVQPHDILFVREYISDNHEFAEPDRCHHQVDFCFRVTILPGEQPGLGTEPDTRQVGVAWLPLSGLAAEPFYPQALKPLLQGLAQGRPAVYLGDIN